ncbi:MAG: response regulator transcription factor [Clostridiales bacterium]|nr:response regulator transcription factor [Clostridiales bacterium]MDD6871258.1 response regulator transcription factor [Clostridiales bacterium]MDD7366733.1 response regulator transcription factor [Clostridiales bacterium]MDY2873526.1 response regulator transcription factor [Eubacteriales bacterium]
MQKILIVEDEKKLARYLQLELMHEGYDIRVSHDGRSAIEQHEAWGSDLILLDLMLPELSGIEVCRRIRQHDDVPIIMLTAKDDVSDKVMGLDMGADDYMTKPFAIEELLARIRVALKRHSSEREGGARVLEEGPLRLDRDSREISWNGQNIPLTKKEFDLLEYLMLNRGVAVSRSELLDKVWGYSYVGDTNVVDVYIRYLRCKLDDPFHVKLIHTVRGVGYLFRLEEDA